ncbi:MAG: hypothetical protein GEU79_05900 [Acidimicrobiia bacterium]|nr:hypothetical protein [Acidimicrobiia bacterium]
METLVAVTATSGLFALARGRRVAQPNAAPFGDLVLAGRDDDLPCPWCKGPTAEHDTRCRSCGRRFG